MTLAGSDLKIDVILGCQTCVFQSNKAWMSQDVYSGAFHSSAVGSWPNGFTEGLTVNYHQACAQFLGPLGQGGNA